MQYVKEILKKFPEHGGELILFFSFDTHFFLSFNPLFFRSSTRNTVDEGSHIESLSQEGGSLRVRSERSQERFEESRLLARLRSTSAI